MKAAKLETRSPLKDKPLRNPGQSVQEEINKVIEDEVESYLVVWVMTFAVAGVTFAQWLFNIPSSIMLAIALFYVVGISIVALPKLYGAIQTIKRLKQARDGEIAVAEYLDLLREHECRVLHDIVGENFNLDHVIISPQGVFTIETKTLSKYVGRNSKLYFDGESISIERHALPLNPIPQAKAQAAWLRNILEVSTGKAFKIKPVVVFPGWYIERLPQGKASDVWVLEPKSLKHFLKNEARILSKEDIALATFHLKRYIRTSA